ncbi:MAG TPA: hypothetical protein VHP33_17490 [Polyangiaceae bacterium]|jgi:hypothetical protein|nr:hypothetical protein [Polyangiaceae bacterium]
MIYKSAILVAAVLALVAVATGKTIRAQRTVVLNGLKYELKLYSDDSLDVAREDGLHFSVDRNGKIDLTTGTRDQLNDASAQMIRSAAAKAGGQQ